MNITDKFLDRILSTSKGDIPLRVVESLRSCLIDTIGVMVAGGHCCREKELQLNSMLLSDGDVSPVGVDIRTSLPSAILINGINAHVLELDDGIKYGAIHPSAPILSALLPVAKVHSVSWPQFVRGALMGYEAAIRLAYSMQPGHYSMGYHPTATCTPLGVAVGIAAMLDFPRHTVKDALSAAALSASGTLKVIEDDSQMKPYNCGRAAMAGYYSSMLAQAGFRGDSDPLGGETGFLAMMSPSYDEDILTAGNDFYYIEKIYQKPYASCRHTHPGIEAAKALRVREGLVPDEISSVEVRTYKGVIGKHDGSEIHSEAAAKMSIPYSVAVTLFTGKAGMEEFSLPYVKDEAILALARSVRVWADESLSKLVPNIRAAEVIIHMKDGRSFSQRVDYPKGDPENPMTQKDVYEKFISMTGYAGLAPEVASEIYDSVMSTPVPDIKNLCI